MKVLVIGATGLTGSLAVQKLLDRGDEVTAFIRKDFPLKHERLKLAQGDARDAAALERAVQGQDAVFSAFGPRSMGKDDLQEAFMRNLVAAMTKAGVKRLSNLSAWGAGESYPELPFVGRMVVKTLLANLFADKMRGEEILFASGLDYVNVRPARLSNSGARGGVKASLSGKDLTTMPMMTRADLAAFMVEQLTSNDWVRKSPLIGYARSL
jgi:uncharacterized protein YbjT (DUF2867 family)